MTVEVRAIHAKRLPSHAELVRFVGGQRHTEAGLTVAEVAEFAGAEVLVTFSARLAWAMNREKRGANDLAREAGISPTAARRWLAGEVERPSTLTRDVLNKVASWLHVTPEWLTDGIGTEEGGPEPAANAGAADLKAVLQGLERAEDKVRAAEDEVRASIRKLKILIGG